MGIVRAVSSEAATAKQRLPAGTGRDMRRGDRRGATWRTGRLSPELFRHILGTWMIVANKHTCSLVPHYFHQFMHLQFLRGQNNLMEFYFAHPMSAAISSGRCW